MVVITVTLAVGLTISCHLITAKSTATSVVVSHLIGPASKNTAKAHHNFLTKTLPS